MTVLLEFSIFPHLSINARDKDVTGKCIFIQIAVSPNCLGKLSHLIETPYRAVITIARQVVIKWNLKRASKRKENLMTRDVTFIVANIYTETKFKVNVIFSASVAWLHGTLQVNFLFFCVGYEIRAISNLHGFIVNCIGHEALNLCPACVWTAFPNRSPILAVTQMKSSHWLAVIDVTSKTECYKWLTFRMSAVTIWVDIINNKYAVESDTSILLIVTETDAHGFDCQRRPWSMIAWALQRKTWLMISILMCN